MANRNPRALPATPDANLAAGGRLPGDLPDVPRTGGEFTGQAARALDLFSERVGRYADDAAKVEGSLAAQRDVAGNAFRPTDSTTLRGQAYDATGNALYMANLSANFERDVGSLYEQHKANPAGFRGAFQKLKAEYDQRHVFPQLQAAFNAKATNFETHYSRAALEGFKSEEKDRQIAGFIEARRNTATSRTRLLTADPNAAGIDKLVDEQIAQERLAIEALVANKQISRVQADQQIADARNEALGSVVAARAGRLGSADEVDAYRRSLREQFAAGKLQIDGPAFKQLDGALGKITSAKRIEDDKATSELSRQIDNYMERQKKGLLPSAAEFAALTVAGNRLGAKGAAMVDEARQKLAFRRQIDALPVEQADALLRQVKREAAAAVNLRPYVSPTLDPANVDRLDAAVSRPLAELFAAMPEDIRKQVTINSGFRSTEKQAALYANRANNPFGVAPPGTSQHEHGMAADLKYASPEAKKWVHDNAARFGLHFPGSDIHIEPIERERKGQGGLARNAAAVLDDAETYLRQRRERLRNDPLGEAERSGTIAGVAPVDWGNADALPAQLAARIDQADAVAREQNRAPAYIRPDEKEALREAITRPGADTLRLITNIVKTAGPRAPAVLAQIQDSAPRLAVIGAMLARGTPEQEAAARDAHRALKLAQEPGAKITPNPKEADRLEREELGGVFRGDIEARQKVIDAARLIYQGRIARGEIEPDSNKGEELYREALQLAAGRSGAGRDADGGVADFKPSANWAGSVKLAVPAGVKASRFPEVIAAMTDLDLAEAPGGAPQTASGEPYKASDFRRAYPVLMPGGALRFQFNPPGQGEPKYIGRKDGRPFELDWQWYSTRARPRVPQAFAR